MRQSHGFSLIEILIVVTILSMLVTIAMPSLMNAMDRSRQGSTLADMRVLGTALERYAVDHQTYPVVEGIAALGPALQPDYLKELPLADGWKNPLVFEVDTKGSTYTLRSLGKDGEPQKDELEAMTHDFAADIVMVDGVFRQRPAGKQGSDAKEKKEAS